MACAREKWDISYIETFPPGLKYYGAESSSKYTYGLLWICYSWQNLTS